jgi:hypothetical protein
VRIKVDDENLRQTSSITTHPAMAMVEEELLRGLIQPAPGSSASSTPYFNVSTGRKQSPLNPRKHDLAPPPLGSPLLLPTTASTTTTTTTTTTQSMLGTPPRLGDVEAKVSDASLSGSAYSEYDLADATVEDE